MEEKSKRHKKTDWLGTIGMSLMLTAVVLMAWFFVHGETTVTGGYPDDEVGVSLSCVLDGEQYLFATYDNSDSKIITINAMFAGEELNSISLIYQLNYNDSSMPSKSEAINHANFNKSLAGAGIADSVLNPNFSVTDSFFRLSLYTNNANYNADTAKYYMANGVSKTIDNLKNGYEAQGFECMEKKN